MSTRRLLIVFLSTGSFAISSLGTEAAEPWHVEGDPRPIAQEIQFRNGDARLVGTLCLPEHGDHLPAVVALHGASDATRNAAVYRHLREGLPAMGVAVLIYDRRGSGESCQGVDDRFAKNRILGIEPRRMARSAGSRTQ
jgi:uncharacterized protein